MPVPMRQPTPGPSTISSVMPAQTHAVNPKKRAGSEAGEDARDAKKVKVDGEVLSLSVNIKEKDKKKKKKKKKRRTSVVLGIPQPPLRERDPSKPRSSAVPPALAPTKRKSHEPTNGHIKSDTEGEQALSSSDKGKGRAQLPPHPQRVLTPPIETGQPVASGSGSVDSIPDQASEIARLKAQLASQKSLLERHQNHIVHHQQSLTCQICLDLMHKPYALAPCGHTTCYGCLIRWFTAPTNLEAAANQVEAENDGIDGILDGATAVSGTFIRQRKNCPVCRAAVTERPIEMWGIKGMVAAFVKGGLGDFSLPIPPTVDNAPNTDPWRNVFRKVGGSNARHFGHMGLHRFFGPPAPPPPPAGDEDREMLGWYDGEDGGIYRCIDCYHEIVYGRCARCGRAYPGHAGHDEDDDDENSDFDDDDPGLPGGLRRFMDDILAEADDMDDESVDDDADDAFFRQQEEGLWGPVHEDEDQEDADGLDEDETHYHAPLYGRMGRALFESDVDDDEDEDGEDLALGIYHPYPHPHQHLAQMLFRNQVQAPRRGAARIEEVGLDQEEEESDYEGSFIDDGAEHGDPASDIEVDDNDEDDDEVEVLDGPAVQPRARPQRRQQVHSILSSDDEVEEVEDPRILARMLGRTSRPGGLRNVGSSRRPVVVDDEDEEDDDQHTDGGSDHEGSDLATGSLSSHGQFPQMFSDDDGSHHEEYEDDEEY